MSDQTDVQSSETTMLLRSIAADAAATRKASEQTAHSTRLIATIVSLAAVGVALLVLLYVLLIAFALLF